MSQNPQVNLAWWQIVNRLDDLIRNHEKLKVEIADSIHDGKDFIVIADQVFLKSDFEQVPDYAQSFIQWITSRHDLRQSTWASYASTMSRFPKDKRPEQFSKLQMGHYQAVDRALLTEAQMFKLLTEFLEAKERGSYADTDANAAIIPVNIHELRKRAELEEKARPADKSQKKRGKPAPTLKHKRGYIGVNIPHKEAYEELLTINKRLKEPLDLTDIPQSAEITISFDISWRELTKNSG